MNNIKKYLIGFIIGLSLVGTFTYAASRGSIGELFQPNGNSWTLSGEIIAPGTITKAKLHSDLKDEINANTAKVGITSAQSNAIAENTAKTVFSGDYNDLENTPTIPDVSNFYTKDQVDAKIRTDEEINTLVAKYMSCVGANIGDECGGGIYSGNNIVTQTSDLGRKNWYNSNTACSNSTALGYSDWYLPNRIELNTLYTNKNSIGIISTYNYWSSVDYNFGRARKKSFSNGSWDDNSKSGYQHVLCIRKV